MADRADQKNKKRLGGLKAGMLGSYQAWGHSNISAFQPHRFPAFWFLFF